MRRIFFLNKLNSTVIMVSREDFCIIQWGREKREIDREREGGERRERVSESGTERYGDTERCRYTERDTKRDRQRHRERERDRDRDRERGGERKREIEIDR